MNSKTTRPGSQMSGLLFALILLAVCANSQLKESIRDNQFTQGVNGIQSFSFLNIAPITRQTPWGLKSISDGTILNSPLLRTLFFNPTSNPARPRTAIIPGSFWRLIQSPRCLWQDFAQALPSDYFFTLNFTVAPNPGQRGQIKVFALLQDKNSKSQMKFTQEFTFDDKLRFYSFSKTSKTPQNSQFSSIRICPQFEQGARQQPLYFITNVYLTEFSCPNGQTPNELISGSIACILNSVIAQSPNCLKFQQKPGSTTEFQCGLCDPNSQLANIIGDNKGCIARQNDAFDQQCSNYDYLQSLFNCSECQSSTQQVSVDFSPNIFVKCLASDDINYDPFCSLYQKDTFDCQKCSSSSMTVVKVFNEVEFFYRCVSSTVNDYNYDDKCLTYNTTFACIECNAAEDYLNVLVQVGETFYRRCKPKRPVQPFCAFYGINGINFNCLCRDAIVQVQEGDKIVSKCKKNPDVNCEVYKTNLKQCARCKTGYEPTANSGAILCIPSNVFENSPNCFRFRAKPESTPAFQCGQCDRNLQLRNITGGFRGCIARQNNAFDLQCNNYNYNYIQSLFNCSDCRNSQKVNVEFSSNIFVQCLTQRDPNYDSDCSLYQKDQNVYKCKQCSSPKIVIQVQRRNRIISKCVQTNPDQNCEVFKANQKQCAKCKTGYQNTPSACILAEPIARSGGNLVANGNGREIGTGGGGAINI